MPSAQQVTIREIGQRRPGQVFESGEEPSEPAPVVAPETVDAEAAARAKDIQLGVLDLVDSLARDVESTTDDEFARYVARTVLDALPLLRLGVGSVPSSDATEAVLHILQGAGDELAELPAVGPAKRLGGAVLECVSIYRREAGR